MDPDQQPNQPPAWPPQPPAPPAPTQWATPPPQFPPIAPYPGQQAHPGQPPYPPPYPPLPGAPPRKKKIPVGAWIAGIVVLLLIAGGAVIALSGGDDDESIDAASTSTSTAGTPSRAPAPSWATGACIDQVSGPTDENLANIHDLAQRRFLAALRRWTAIDCRDGRATAKITAVGGTATGKSAPYDDGCPDDTDLTVSERGLNAGATVYCARLLEGPHPGDPGKGGGHYVVGDCAAASSSDGNRVLNDEVFETECASHGYWAKVLQIATAPKGCTAPGTLTRLAATGYPGKVLCLGKGDKGVIPAPGDCMDLPSNKYYVPIAKKCTAPNTYYRLIALVDRPNQCAADTHALQQTGYDRYLCVRYLDGS